jgi:hypothetical protein
MEEEPLKRGPGRPPTKGHARARNFRLPLADWENLERLAVKLGMNENDVMLAALRDLVKREGLK